MAFTQSAGPEQSKDAKNKFCKMEQVPTGRKYRNSAGEEREATTLKFLALYDTEAECEAAYLAELNTPASDSSDDSSTPPLDPPADSSSAADPGRDTARAFVEALAKQHHGDLNEINRSVANIPAITKYFPAGSDDLVTVVKEVMRAA